jgi:hypothetical protein
MIKAEETKLLLTETQRLQVDALLGPIKFPKRRGSVKVLTRKATLHRWRNANTGQVIEATAAELGSLVGFSYNTRDLINRTTVGRDGWQHVEQLYSVIQGDVVEWLTTGNVRGISNSAQYREKISGVWDKWVLIVSLYRDGHGCKAIARKLGLNADSILPVLRECGIDTSARRNYPLRGVVRSAKDKLRERYLRDVSSPEGRLKRRVMSRIWSAMKRQTVNARGTFSAVGCSADELRAHIEKQFTPGMTWANYGEWHVDHIRPCASFDLSDPEQFAACFNWSNLQPLWAAENLSKSDTYAQN